MPPRSRRAKSQSISSQPSEPQTPVLNGGMAPPPSPPASTSARVSPAISRRKASSAANKPNIVGPATTTAIAPKSAHAPTKISASTFALVVLITSGTEIVLKSANSLVEVGDLAAISRKPSENDLYLVAGLLGWRILALGAYWFSGFDAIDVASLTTLLTTPSAVLQYFFYNISAVTILSTSLTSIISTSLPFYLLRPLASPHDHPIHNRSIITDPLTTGATTLFSALTFAATLQATFSTFLPSFLITRFAGLRSLEVTHSLAETLPLLVIALLPAGFATTQFLFRPAEGATSSTAASIATGANSVEQAPAYHFDSATSSFMQHIYHNSWGWYTARQKELIGRSIVLALLLGTETVVDVWGTIHGVEVEGALGYACVWCAGVGILGGVLDWVGRPSD